MGVRLFAGDVLSAIPHSVCKRGAEFAFWHSVSDPECQFACFNTHNVFVEYVADGLLVKPAPRHLSFADLFEMMDAAQQEEGVFEVDRADNQVPAAGVAF